MDLMSKNCLFPEHKSWIDPPPPLLIVLSWILKKKSVFYPIHLALTCSRDVFIYCVATRVRLPDFWFHVFV